MTRLLYSPSDSQVSAVRDALEDMDEQAVADYYTISFEDVAALTSIILDNLKEADHED